MRYCFQTALPGQALSLGRGKPRVLVSRALLGEIPFRSECSVGRPTLFLSIGGKDKGLTGKGPDTGPDWLKQFDAVLPGYTLKSQLDILSLLKQVGLGRRVGFRKKVLLGQRRQ